MSITRVVLLPLGKRWNNMILFLSGDVRAKRSAHEEKAKIVNGAGYCAINEPKNDLKR